MRAPRASRWLAAIAALGAALGGCICADCFPTLGDEYRCLRTNATTGVQDAAGACALSLGEATSIACTAEYSSCSCVKRDDVGACVYKQAVHQCR